MTPPAWQKHMILITRVEAAIPVVEEWQIGCGYRAMRPPVWAEPECTFGTYLDSGVKKRMRKLQFTLLDHQKNTRSGSWCSGSSIPRRARARAERRYRELPHAAVEVLAA